MTDFSKLRYFSDLGYEIPIQIVYNLTWSLSLKDHNPFIVVSYPEGYICSNEEQSVFEIDNNFINRGLFSLKPTVANSGQLINGYPISSKEGISELLKERIKELNVTYTIFSPTKKSWTINVWSRVKDYITFRIREIAYNYEDDKSNPEFTDYCLESINLSDEGKIVLASMMNYFLNGKYEGGEPAGKIWDVLDTSYIYNYNTEANSSIDFSLTDDVRTHRMSIKEQLKTESLWPFFSFIGSLRQEEVSSELVSSNTIFVLEDTSAGPDSAIHNFRVPCYENSSDAKAEIVFATAENTELRFITNDENVDEITWSHSLKLPLANPDITNNTPLSFAIGFMATEEGCYKNYLNAFYHASSGKLYSLGTIVVETEVIGEDERYRTLFTNFGIPDPVTYPNLFKEKDPDEESIDWELVNVKSKELFLSYDQIFPYAGTYKALMNAVRFLGYDDIYFKEWYKVIDDNKEAKTVLFKTTDFKNKQILESKLKKIGVSIEDFQNYRKLNKLTLMYQFLLEDDTEDVSYDLRVFKPYKDENGNYYSLAGKESELILNTDNEPYKLIWKDKNLNRTEIGEYTKYSQVFDIPATRENYEYNSTAVLAKLWSLKKWLEKYVIGINCHIADVTGEGVYFYRTSSTVYSTGNYTIDYFKEANLTPINYKVDINANQLINSSALVRCTFTEFENTTFDAYENTPIWEFVDSVLVYDFDADRAHITNNSYNKDYESETVLSFGTDGLISKPYSSLEKNICISAPIEAPFLLKEFSYNLELDASCGTLFEAASIEDQTTNNVILVKDNEITFYDEKSIESGFDSSKLPDITLKKANIRKTFGDWSSNILYTIKPVTSVDDGKTCYQMKYIDPSTGYTNFFVSDTIITLKPVYEKTASGITTTSSLKYTERNKYNVPLFVMENYHLNNPVDASIESLFNLDENSYIIEILDGEMRFDTVDDSNSIISMELDFSVEDAQNYNINNEVDNDADEQFIQPSYNFKSGRIPFYNMNIDVDEIVIPNIELNPSEINDYISIASTRYLNKFQEILDKNNICINDDAKNDYEQWASNYTIYDASSMYNTEFSESISEIYTVWQSAIRENMDYNVNKYVDVNVNRIGDYTLSAVGYDRDNNIYFNNSNTSVNVWGTAPSVNIITNSEFSNNNENWFIENTYGEPNLDSSLNPITDEILARTEDSPLYPRTWRVYDLSVGENNISYESISYAIDTPKKNDFFNLDPLTEICTSIDIASKKLCMLDENEDCQQLYFTGAKLNIYIYDKLRMEVVDSFGPYTVDSSYYKVDSNEDELYSDQSFIILKEDIDEKINEYASKIANREYTAYLYNVTEHDVNIQKCKTDLESGNSIININTPIDENVQRFNIGDVVKIKYLTSDTDFTNYDKTKHLYFGEACYRILAYRFYSDTKTQEYTIDGKISNTLLENLHNNKIYDDSKIYAKLSYPQYSYVNYAVQVNGNADEEAVLRTSEYEQESSISDSVYAKTSKVKNFYNDTLQLLTTFSYDSSKWFAKYYLDNTYSGWLQDYDYRNLKSAWVKPSEYFNSLTDLYTYTDFPVSLPKDRIVIIDSKDNVNTFVNYRPSWKVTTEYSDITDYIDSNLLSGNISDSPVLFRSSNKVLSLLTKNAGPNKIYLEAIDPFGNRLVNGRSGVFVKA